MLDAPELTPAFQQRQSCGLIADIVKKLVGIRSIAAGIDNAPGIDDLPPMHCRSTIITNSKKAPLRG